MLKISQVVTKAEELYAAFNKHFYNGELPNPAITVHPDGGRGAYGWVSVREIWTTDSGAYYELNLCAEYLNRPLTEIARTILHEMAHLYNITHEILDTSNNGYYHNKRFKSTAEAHGLNIEKDSKYGWMTGKLNAEAEEWVHNTFGDESINASRLATMQESKGRKASKNRSIKYVCPCCGTSVRATKVVNILCGDCDENMEPA